MSIYNGLMYIQRDLAGPDGATAVADDFMVFDDELEEVFNHARTEALVRNMGVKNFSLDNLYDGFGDLEELFRLPDGFWPGGATMTSEPTSVADGGANPAPWYDASVLASTEACGFKVLDCTGLDGGIYRREVSAAHSSGASVGPLRAGERIITVRVLVIAQTSRGAEYLYRWLETKLASLSQNSNDTLAFRAWPQTSSQLADYADESSFVRSGLQRTGRASLMQGPTVESSTNVFPNLVECSFTLVAAAPALSAPIQAFTPSVNSAAPPAESAVAHTCSQPAGHQFTFAFPQSEIGRAMPVVNIGCNVERASAQRANFSEMVVGIMDSSDPCTANFISGFRLRRIPSGAIIRLDWSARRAFMYDPWLRTTPADWSAGVPVRDSDPLVVGAEGYQAHSGDIVDTDLTTLKTWALGSGAGRAVFVSFATQGSSVALDGVPTATTNYAVSCAFTDVVGVT